MKEGCKASPPSTILNVKMGEDSFTYADIGNFFIVKWHKFFFLNYDFPPKSHDYMYSSYAYLLCIRFTHLAIELAIIDMFLNRFIFFDEIHNMYVSPNKICYFSLKPLFDVR